MSMVPMKKCDDCGNIFEIVNSKVTKCPKCGSEKINKATELDLLNSVED